MPYYITAMRVYNNLIKHTDYLCELGDNSNGRRLEIYKIMAPDYFPRPYNDWIDYYSTALEKGFDDDPRSCWTLIRISKHGTIEFRMFGSSRDLSKIVFWARECHRLCLEAT